MLVAHCQNRFPSQCCTANNTAVAHFVIHFYCERYLHQCQAAKAAVSAGGRHDMQQVMTLMTLTGSMPWLFALLSTHKSRSINTLQSVQARTPRYVDDDSDSDSSGEY